MSEPESASDELAGLALDAIGAGVALWRAFLRALVITVVALVVIGTPFVLWGWLVGWS